MENSAKTMRASIEALNLDQADLDQRRVLLQQFALQTHGESSFDAQKSLVEMGANLTQLKSLWKSGCFDADTEAVGVKLISFLQDFVDETLPKTVEKLAQTEIDTLSSLWEEDTPDLTEHLKAKEFDKDKRALQVLASLSQTVVEADSTAPPGPEETSEPLDDGSDSRIRFSLAHYGNSPKLGPKAQVRGFGIVSGDIIDSNVEARIPRKF